MMHVARLIVLLGREYQCLVSPQTNILEGGSENGEVSE